jgi:hypothetical protein
LLMSEITRARVAAPAVRVERSEWSWRSAPGPDDDLRG